MVEIIYINKNTQLRKQAKNEFEKNFFKLMNNAVFGKMIENVRKYRGIKLVTKEGRKKLVSQPNYVSCNALSDELLAIEMKKTKISMNKPILVGQTILDKSKIIMYKFLNDYIKPKYEDKVKLLYLDTDSYTLHKQREDFYKDINNDLDEWFDTSK